jgi:hypothetical protein
MKIDYALLDTDSADDVLFDTDGAALFLGCKSGALANRRARGMPPRYLKFQDGSVRYRKKDLLAHLRTVAQVVEPKRRATA